MTDPEVFFTATYHAFLKAEKKSPSVTRFFRIGPSTVCLRFAGAPLALNMTNAIEHLSILPVKNPDLTVCAFDGLSAGVMLPALPTASRLEKGMLTDYSNESIKSAFFIDSCLLAMLNSAERLGIFWIKDAGDLPYHERCFPMRSIFHWWFRLQKVQIAHAAAVGTPTGGALIVGRSGSGKSTTALSCLTKNLLYAGDDYLLLGQDPLPRAYSLSSSAKLHCDSIKKLLPALPKLKIREKTNNDKSIVLMYPEYADKLIRGFPVKALLVPGISGRNKTTITKATQAKALLAIAPSTVIPLPGADKRDFHFLSAFVAKVPSYTLELGTDYAEVAGRIADWLSSGLKHG